MRIIPLGRVFGIKINLHYSWFVIAFLITLSLVAMSRRAAAAPGLEIWAIAASTSILFFVCLLIHELSHAAVARWRGLSVRGITLFALGGMAQSGGETPDAGTEFMIGLVGPVVSAALGFLCMAVVRAMGPAGPVSAKTLAQTMLAWLGTINIALAVFNMIPGYPLDGGRVLRAAIWAATGDRDRATLGASRVGQVVAALFIAWGLLNFFAGASFGGLWLAFIGFFLFEAAAASHQEVEFHHALDHVRVGELMRRDVPAVDGREDLETFVERELLPSGQRCFVVRERGELAGLVTTQEVGRIPRESWHSTPVDRAMLPMARLHVISPSASAWEALEIMARDDVNQLPVVHDSTLDGIVTRGDVLRAMAVRRELGRV